MSIDLLYGVGLGICLILPITVRAYRRNNSLKELLRREKESSFERYNKIVTTLSKTFSQGRTPTLTELASDLDSEFTLKP